MTRNTNRNNIKPMLFSMAVPMMVFFSLVGAIMAFKLCWFGQISFYNFVIYCTSCFSALWITNVIQSRLLLIVCFTPIGFVILLAGFNYVSTTYFGRIIILTRDIRAFFAIVSTSVFSTFIFVKFRQWFDLLAFDTFSYYDLLGHNRLLIRRLWLEPVSGDIPVSGSLYYLNNLPFVNNYI